MRWSIRTCLGSQENKRVHLDAKIMLYKECKCLSPIIYFFFSHSISNRYETTEPFYTAYLSVPTKHGALVKNSVPFVEKCQFNKTRIFLTEEKHFGIVFQLSKH